MHEDDDVLVINTAQSMYKPVRVKIDGKYYEVARIFRDMQQKIMEMDRALKDGDLDVPYKRLELLLGPQDFINKLDIEQAEAICQDIIKKVYGPRKEGREEKNARGPGESKPQQ